MDNINFEIRKRQLENLKQFICSSLEKTNSIINFMGWDASKVVEDKGPVQCSIQSSHRMPASSLHNHVNKCILRQEGYSLDENFLSEPPESATSSIYIGDDTKTHLFLQAQRNTPGFKCGWNGRGSDPKTSDRLTSTFTGDERLALYDYAIANTESHQPLPEFDVFAPKPERPLSYEEKLIIERNAKRRRTKYKAVHTNKKNHTEIMREVIDGQMKLYEEWCTENATPSDGKNAELICKHDSERSHSSTAGRSTEFGDSQHRCSSKKKCHREKRHESEHHQRRHRN